MTTKFHFSIVIYDQTYVLKDKMFRQVSKEKSTRLHMKWLLES